MKPFAFLSLALAGGICCCATTTISARTHALQYEEVEVAAPFPMPPIRVPVFPERDFVVTEFGARPGGDISEAIRQAIAACHEAGGGRVVIPAGNWRTGKIHLKSNVNLHVAGGARLTFSGNPADYLPAVQSSWEGYECYNYSPLIYAFECENIGLTGEGTIEADLTTWKQWMARPPAHLEALKRLYHLASTNAPVAQRQMAEGENNLRPQFIQFNRCRNVRLEGLRIRNSPFWTVHLLLCDSVLVRGLDIVAHGHNNDGIDPEMTRNLLIENCRFDQGDDAIAIKAGSNQDGWRLGVPTENVVIRNCTVVRGHQLVAIGSELSAGVRNVLVQDCRFENPKYQLQNVLFIKTNHRRGGFVENIHLENVTAGAVRYSVLGIETDVLYQWRDLVPTYETRLTRIRGIHLRNVRVEQTGQAPFRILGDRRAPVQDVTLENITVGRAPTRFGRYEHADDVRETGVRVGEEVPGEAPR
jgi:polygalacturonase